MAFIHAVKDMHDKMKNISTPAPTSQPSQKVIIQNAVKLIQRYPRLLASRTGK